MKTALRIASYVVILTVGIATGYYFGFSVGEGRALAFDMMEKDYYSAYAEMQMTEGNNATREEVVRGFLALTEKRKGHWTPMFTERVYAIDSALANARLSAMAQNRGATQEAEQYLNRATSFCPQVGWRDCSAAQIMSMAQRLDKYGLFGDPKPQ